MLSHQGMALLEGFGGGFIGGHLSLGVGMGSQKLKPGPVAFFFLPPVDLDVELLAPPPTPCLSMCYHASCHSDNGLNL